MKDSSTITEEYLDYAVGNSTNRITRDLRDLIVETEGLRDNASYSDHCDWLEECIRKIRELRSLSAGWDSYSAAAPSQRMLDSAESLIDSLCRGFPISRPDVAATPNGGLQFSWSNGSRYFEIEIVGEQAATYLYEDTDRKKLLEGELFVRESLGEAIALIRRVGTT